MRRFIFLLILLFPAIAAAAGSCTVVDVGYYDRFQAARDACYPYHAYSSCKNGPVNSGYYWKAVSFSSYYPNGGVVFKTTHNCSSFSGDNDLFYYRFHFSSGYCPDGTNNLNGLCTCNSGQFNYETKSCEEPEVPQCQPPTTYSDDTGLCQKECPVDKPWSNSARDCTPPPEPQSCSNQTGGPSNLAGNPINFFSGHKIQREVVFEGRGDFPLTFSWLYNSFGNHQKSGSGYSVGGGVVGETMVHTEQPLPAGEQPISLPLDKDPAQEYTGGSTEHWRHNHSYFLAHYTLPDGTTERLIAYRPNGNDLHFVDESGVFVALANRNWRATRDLDESQEHTGWTLKVDGRIERYDTAGRILRVENEQGKGITYTYDGSGIQQETIADDSGSSITMAYTDGKLTQLTRNDSAVYQFAYNGNDLLQSITFPGSESPQRVFRYEDARFSYALTGVTDKAGKVFSSFVYDEQGRAIRSEHNGGAESVDVEFVGENTRRLTNALDKQTTYHYSDVNGVKRITSVKGEASANCAAANKGYTYDAKGFVASETDWESHVTTYTRDNLGRELTRTEAADTPEVQKIITARHLEFDVPAKVSVTDYSYDNSGRLLGKKVVLIAS